MSHGFECGSYFGKPEKKPTGRPNVLGCQALVGRTGTSMDAHLAAAVGLVARPGHMDFFHAYDGAGRTILCHRGTKKKATPAAASAAAPKARNNTADSKSSSESSSSTTSSTSSQNRKSDQADARPKPKSPLTVWTNMIRGQRKLLRRGQGRCFLNAALLKKGFKKRAGIMGPSPTRYLVYAKRYLEQSLRHFGVSWTVLVPQCFMLLRCFLVALQHH